MKVSCGFAAAVVGDLLEESRGIERRLKQEQKRKEEVVLTEGGEF